MQARSLDRFLREAISTSLIFSFVLIFFSFSVSYGELQVFDRQLIGIFELSSISVNFYSIADKLFYFVQGLFFNAPFIADLSKHKTGFGEIFTNFRRVGWKRLPVYIIFPTLWFLGAVDSYDLQARIEIVLLVILAPIIIKTYKSVDHSDRERVVDKILGHLSLVYLLFLALTNFGSHLTYEKIVRFNSEPGINFAVDQRPVKATIIFSSPGHMVVFAGGEFILLGEKFGGIKKKFTDVPVDGRTYLTRIIESW